VGKAVNTERCPVCASYGRDNSGDNLVIYDDGSAHCFACGYNEFADEEPDLDNDLPWDADSHFIKGSYQDIPHRGLSRRTCEFIDYQVGVDDHGNSVHIENFKNNVGQVVAQKLRGANKQFKVLGDSKQMNLYGEWLWEATGPNPSWVVVTEGVIDAASILEVQGLHFPVVSIPNGASGAAATIKRSLEWLSKWKYVVLAFDNDDAGRKATKECLEILEPGKVRVALWPLKDANEMLVAGRGDEIKTLLFNAKEVRPDGIVTFSDVRDLVITKPSIGLSWPWPTMTKLTYGIRPHELITVMAASGIGKTEVVAEIFIHLIQQHGVRCGVMSFEQPPHKTYQRAIGKLLNKRIHVPGVDFDVEEVDRLGREVFDDKLFCYSRAGTVKWDDVRSKLLYYKKSLDCNVIVIDNLSSIAAKFDADERRGIDRAMLELSELAMTMEITIILVCHISRSANKRTPFEQGGMITLRDARGSEGIGQHSTYVFGLERNTLAEEEEIRNITTVRCLKDREYGTARGQYFKIRYDITDGRLKELGYDG
jgi:twinkle protein